MTKFGNHDSVSLHDGELLNVAIDRDSSTARLSFRLENGEHRTVELAGLMAIRCTDLIFQNVVSRVLRSRNKELDLTSVGEWLDWVTSLSDTGSWLSGTRKQQWLTQLHQGSLDLVVFEPSAGAQIAAVCERFEIM